MVVLAANLALLLVLLDKVLLRHREETSVIRRRHELARGSSGIEGVIASAVASGSEEGIGVRGTLLASDGRHRLAGSVI